jgi:uncharacterized membrane protein
MNSPVVLDVLLTSLAVGIALWLAPWRCVAADGPPWAWGAAWGAVTLLWAGMPGDELFRPMTGVTLLVLLAGWPLAVLGMVLAVGVAALVAGAPLSWPDAIQRLVWLGLVPATCVLVIGALVRRWLPRHLFAYILGRGYLGTLLASLLVGAGFQADAVSGDDLLVANLLIATGEASVCGTLVAILAVLRPQWLATYNERLYRSP